MSVVRVSKLGTPIYFYGLLATDGARALSTDGIPIARAGNVAQTAQSGIRWEHNHFTAPSVHLIDIRSQGGFSGSPVFAQFSHPGPKVTPLPESFAKDLRESGRDPESIGDQHLFTTWWGMFVAHDKQSGIGVVIPESLILEFLESKPFKELERKQDEIAARARGQTE